MTLILELQIHDPRIRVSNEFVLNEIENVHKGSWQEQLPIT